MLMLKKIAKKKGMSIYKVARECNQRAGITEQNVYDWANGRRNPCPDNLKLLCEVLKCDSKELLGF